jgi:hypothetical protein
VPRADAAAASLAAVLLDGVSATSVLATALGEDGAVEYEHSNVRVLIEVLWP